MTNRTTIRWGIAGTGTIARQFAEDIKHARAAVLAAVSSRDMGRAREFAGRHPGIEAHGSLAGMISSGAIDAVYLATPNAAHHAQALECIAAGMPVLVEKPLAAKLEEAQAIRSEAQTSGSFVMEAMWSRYLPAIRALRAALRDGIIGKIHRIEAELAWKHAYAPESRFFDKASGGGALHDLGVYPISLARYFLGDAVDVTSSWTAAPTGVDMAARLEIRFLGGSATIACGFDREGSNRMLIEGATGVIVLSSPFIKASGFTVYPSRRLADLAQPGGAGLPARLVRKLFSQVPLPGSQRYDFRFEGGGLQFEIDAASQAILQGLVFEPDNTLDDTIAALEIIDTVLAAPPSDG